MVKVEMQRNDEKGIISLAFECSKPEDHEILDAVRVAIMGNHEKTGGYLNSSRFVVHIKES